MKNVFWQKGQNLAELALIIGVIGLVFVGVQVYVKRAIQGRVKDVTDLLVSSKQTTNDEGVPETIVSTFSSTITSTESKGGIKTYTGSETSTYDPSEVTTVKSNM